MENTWRKPQLIVLARGKPEEAILQTCKALSNNEGPMALAIGCHTQPDSALSAIQCLTCFDLSDS